MNRRGFLKLSSTAAIVSAAAPLVSALPLPKKVEELTPEHLPIQTKPERMGEVMFIAERDTIVMATVIRVRSNNRIDLEAEIPHPDWGLRHQGKVLKATFMRVRRAVPKDLGTSNIPGTWFLPFDLSAPAPLPKVKGKVK